MPRKKQKVDTLEEIETNIKLLCDQSNNHMKVREYYKALTGYNQVNYIFILIYCTRILYVNEHLSFFEFE